MHISRFRLDSLAWSFVFRCVFVCVCVSVCLGGWVCLVWWGLSYSTCKFSQFLNLESSFPKSHVNICLALRLALTTPLDLYQWGWVELGSSSSAFVSFNLIWFRIPTSSSSILWLIPTETSMYFALNVHAKHFPSETRRNRKLFFVTTMVDQQPEGGLPPRRKGWNQEKSPRGRLAESTRQEVIPVPREHSFNRSKKLLLHPLDSWLGGRTFKSRLNY